MTMTDRLTRLRQNRSIAEVFKTPGKLRGKTPRTARKRNGLEGRAVSRASASRMLPEI